MQLLSNAEIGAVSGGNTPAPPPPPKPTCDPAPGSLACSCPEGSNMTLVSKDGVVTIVCVPDS